MADRWALIVAVDRYLDPAVAPVPYSESGARAVTEALAAVGYPTANQFVLLGSQATRAVVGSRLRKLRKAVRKGDAVLVYWSGRGFSRDGAGFLACWDTQADDPIDTALPLAELVAAVTGAKVEQAAVLLDVGSGSAVGELQPDLDDNELVHLFDESKAVALTATSPGEESHASAGLKASVWTSLIVDALSGRAAKATDRDGSVTARSLHRHLEDELPRVLRRHFEAGVTQTPRLFGEPNAGAVIADLSPLVGGLDGGFLLDPDRLRRVLFRTESTGRVRDLADWRKSFEVPTSAGPSSRKFVARIATSDVRADLDAVYETAREHLGYKRKDLDASAGSDGVGQLRTPDFEYTVTAALDPEDPSKVVWRREVGQFVEPGFIRGPGFGTVFGKQFDQLVFEFARPVDVAALVDRLEDRPPRGAKVQVASDEASCDISLAGFAGRVTVDRHSLTVRGRAGNSAGLLDQFLAFLKTVGPLGEPLMLPRGR